MKKSLLFFPFSLLILFFPSLLHGQIRTAKAFYGSDSVAALYLGIDFTKARLINDANSNPREIQYVQFDAINDLMVSQSKKYDIKNAYHRIQWSVDLSAVRNRNEKTSPDQLRSSNDNDLMRLQPSDIDELVQSFDFGTHDGYGILLIVEGMSKTAKKITIWFTLIDLGARKVLSTARVEGKLGSGFGFRNYWASAIKNAIGQVKRDEYEQWKTAAGD